MTSLGKVGKYDLLKNLAVGGMAEIFLARQSGPEGFSKLVVIKKILPNLAVQDRFISMFLDEARVAARFNHPNIVQIFDLGRDDDAFFIAMEYIPGEDIKSVVRRCAKVRQRIPVEHTVKIFSGVLDGLHFAHSQENLDGHPTGVVHRDVSPHNIIVSFQGGIKLVDFGIAKARTQISTTVPGRVKGKHAYMSPEQVRGHDLDGRSDVFAVGIVMYELLTWSRLFKRKKHIDTLRAVCEAEIRPLRALNPDIDEELERIVLKSLERDKDARYATAQEMQMDLEDYLLSSGLRSNPVLLGKFVSDLFSEKLLAQEKALSVAKASDLEGAILAKDEQGPDLVAFLDMFFAEGTSGLSPDTDEDLSAPEFTPSADYTPADFNEAGPVTGKINEIPARAQREYLTRRAPEPRAPEGMSVQFVSPKTRQEDETVPRFDGVPPAQNQPESGPDPLQFSPSGDIIDPAAEALVDPEAYSEQIDPLGTGGKSKGWLVILVILMMIGGGVTLFMFKDELTKVEAPAFGLVEVKSIPSGADVYLDGQHQQARTPMQIDDMKPGEEHLLEVSLPDLPKWSQKFTLSDTTKPLVIKAVLSKSAADKARMKGKPIISGASGTGQGSLEVTSEPADALIYLDGVATGKKTPAVLKNIPAGLDHVVMVETKGMSPAFTRLHLKNDEVAQVALKFDPASEALGGRLKVRFETDPEGAKVSINGYPMNKATPMAAGLLAGRQSEIELEISGKKKALKVRPVPQIDLTIFVEFK